MIANIYSGVGAYIYTQQASVRQTQEQWEHKWARARQHDSIQSVGGSKIGRGDDWPTSRRLD